MSPTLTSERDRDVLRSFARRIDPSDAGRAQQPRRPLLQQGVVRGGGERVHARAGARPEDAGCAAQPGDRLLQHRLLRQARRRAATSGCARAPTIATRAGSWAARTRCSDRPPRRWPSSPSCCATHPTDIGALVQLGSPSARTATSTRRSAISSARWRSIRRAPCVNFYIGEVLYNRGVNEGALAALRARRGAQSAQSRRATT